MPDQLHLFEQEKPVEQPEAEVTEVKPHKRRRGKAHPGRNPLPEHLPEEVTVIEPEEDTSSMLKIGEERTEYIDYTPASLIKKVIIRPKYADRKKERIPLFDSCLANDVEPYSWLKDVLERIPGHPVNRLEELMPCNFSHANHLLQKQADVPTRANGMNE